MKLPPPRRDLDRVLDAHYRSAAVDRVGRAFGLAVASLIAVTVLVVLAGIVIRIARWALFA